MLVELVILLGLLFCTIIAFILYKSKVDFLLKLIALPLSVIFSLTAIYALIILAGSPIIGFPTKKFDYIAHIVIEEGKEIVLWARPDDFDDFRLYQFPYSRKVEKQLRKAAQKGEKGKVKGEFKQQMSGGKRIQELFLHESKPELETDNPVKSRR